MKTTTGCRNEPPFSISFPAHISATPNLGATCRDRVTNAVEWSKSADVTELRFDFAKDQYASAYDHDLTIEHAYGQEIMQPLR